MKRIRNALLITFVMLGIFVLPVTVHAEENTILQTLLEEGSMGALTDSQLDTAEEIFSGMTSEELNQFIDIYFTTN